MIVPVDESNLLRAGAVHAAAWRDSHRAFCTPEFVKLHTEERQADYLQKKMDEGSRVWLLIEDKPVGVVSVCGSLIEDLYVLPERQNRGYGTALLRFAVSECDGTPTLWILENNERARRLYERLGFSETGRRHVVKNGLDEIEFALGGGMRHQWVIFDLDGTLTDSGEGIKNSTVYALDRLGLPVPADSELRKMVGPPLSVGFSLLGVPANRIDEAVRLYREQYSARGKYQNRVYPGIEDCLKRLRGAGLRLCVGTSKPEPLAREILSEFSLAPYFAYIAGATFDASRQNKDDVLCYLLSATGAEDAVMVGDTHYDVIGAHRRGIPCIGVTWGYGLLSELEAAGADALAASPEALSDFLLS